jgi:hypothetical protein
MTQVTDDLPGKQDLTPEEIEAQSQAVKQQLQQEYAAKEVKESKFPTEVIDLPSKGLLYPEGHPLANGQIEMKYMTAKEEDILTSQNLIKKGVVIDKLLQSLIVTPVDYNDLLLGDKNAIMIAARVLGYGKDYPVEVTCEHCKEKNKINVDLTEVEDSNFDETNITPHQNIFKYTLPQANRTIEYSVLTHRTERLIADELNAMKKVTAKSGVNKEVTTRLKHLIVSVDGNTDKGYIRNFVDNELFAMDSRALRTEVQDKMPDVDLNFGFVCTECQETNESVKIPINVNFFWPGA